MSLLDSLSRPEVWERFYEYKCSRAIPPKDARALRTLIDEQQYLPVCEGIRQGRAFPLPKKAVISKLSSGKKRVVYTYPEPENTVLKLLTHLLLRSYDHLFCPALYSFRPGVTARDAVRRLIRTPGIWSMAAYQADVRNYFNSVPVERLLPMLSELLGEDPALLAFLTGLLTEPRVLERGAITTEEKGIMAGTPLSAFYANVYLRELDRRFYDRGILYARYSDDIILFAPDLPGARALAGELREALADMGLALNPEKERFTPPGIPWTFLGFACGRDGIDIAPVTVKKIQGKMRRKARALLRWRQRNGLPPEKAARAFIRIFRRKLLEGGDTHDLTWSRWFFPVITRTDSLERIDHYAQDCLRYLLTARRNKGRFAARYADLKALDYESLVHAYYQDREASVAPEREM